MPNGIRELRLALGLTIDDVARLGGLSPSTVLRAEHASVRTNRSTLACLAAALGCHPDELGLRR